MRLTILFLCILFAACSASKSTNESKTKHHDPDGIKPVNVMQTGSFNDFHKSINFSIERATVLHGVLELHVVYSGGCAEHSFDLYSTNELQKSLPPKLPLFLAHDTGGDACREVVEEIILFDISQLSLDAQEKIIIVINQDFEIEYNN